MEREQSSTTDIQKERSKEKKKEGRKKKEHTKKKKRKKIRDATMWEIRLPKTELKEN